MGWTYTTKRQDETTQQFFERYFNYNENGRSGKILACSVVKSVAYIAYEVRVPDAAPQVVGLVCLIKRSHGEFNFGYKDMSEGEHPYYYDCPSHVLDLLTPTTNEFALEWREKCRLTQKQKTP